MAEATEIAWCDATFNPWRGCAKVSEGCKFCYAETLSGRNHGTLGVWGPNGTRVAAAEGQWKLPLKWDRLAAQGKLPDGTPNTAGHRPRVFCASLADVFEDWGGAMVDAKGRPLRKRHDGTWITDGTGGVLRSDFPLTMQDVRVRLFDLIDRTPNLNWLVLTKRPENILRMTHDAWCRPVPGHVSQNPGDGHHWKYPPNTWIGTSVENQKAADERIPHLLRVPAKVRFLSCEPLLGSVDLELDRYESPGWFAHRKELLHWVIVGGESGHNARPMNLAWAADVVSQCKNAGVPVFVKQLGAAPVRNRGIVLNDGESLADLIDLHDARTGKPLKDKKGGDWNEWPEALRVRQFPA